MNARDCNGIKATSAYLLRISANITADIPTHPYWVWDSRKTTNDVRRLGVSNQIVAEKEDPNEENDDIDHKLQLGLIGEQFEVFAKDRVIVWVGQGSEAGENVQIKNLQKSYRWFVFPTCTSYLPGHRLTTYIQQLYDESEQNHQRTLDSGQ